MKRPRANRFKRREGIKPGIAFIALVLSFTAAVVWAQDVNEGELDTAAGRAYAFQDYTGPNVVVESVDEIVGVGEVLSRSLSANGSQGNYFGKYRVIRAFDPAATSLLSADIIVFGPDARVDHIRNVQRIVAGYLEAAFGYSPAQASALAVLVTSYNAAYRGDIATLSRKYTPLVMSNLSAENAGIALQYTEWPGKTRLVIPLGRQAGGQAGTAPALGSTGGAAAGGTGATGGAGTQGGSSGQALPGTGAAPQKGLPAGNAGRTGTGPSGAPASGAAAPSTGSAPGGAAASTAPAGAAGQGPAAAGQGTATAGQGTPAAQAPSGSASAAGQRAAPASQGASSAAGERAAAAGEGTAATTAGQSAPGAAGSAASQPTAPTGPGFLARTFPGINPIWIILIALLIIAALALLAMVVVRIVRMGPRLSLARALYLSAKEGHPVIEMVVTTQNRHIGLRNVHYLRPGSSAAVGGGRSPFLVYFVPVPPRMAVLKYDGRRYTFVPVRTELFPDVAGPIEDCLGKLIPAKSPRGYRFVLVFNKYLSPLDEINRLMRSTRALPPGKLPPTGTGPSRLPPRLRSG